MFRGLTVELECDGCGRLFRVDHADGAFRIPAGWTLFDLVMDVARWHGTGHVYADGRWFCDACDNAAGGCPGGEETDDATDVAADAERPGLRLPVEYSTVEIRCLQRDLDSIRETANGATRTAEELVVLLDDVNNAFDYVVKWAAETREYWDADADMKVGKRLIALSGRLPGYAAEIDAVHALRIRVKNTLERFPTNATGPRIEPLGTAEGLTKNVWQIAAQRALIEANRRLDEIRDELCGQNFTVLGWHQNGDAEPLDSWFENNEWGPVVLSDYEPPADGKPLDPTNPVARAVAALRNDLLTAYLRDVHIPWSRQTFGPGMRTKGICRHIELELDEIRANPYAVDEWIDVAILALDGAWRSGVEAGDVVSVLFEKMEEIRTRTYPAPVSDDEPSEHVRDAGGDGLATP